VKTLIGGVGYRWQRDASFGLAVSDAMTSLQWPEYVELADLGYGAIYVTQDLRNASPPYKRIILITSAVRDRKPGSLTTYKFFPEAQNPEELQARIQEAGAGVIDIDHLLYIADYFKALPEEVLVYEIEPVDSDGGEGLSPQISIQVDEVIKDIRMKILAELPASAFDR
jgi:hydrogenase maturation protease